MEEILVLTACLYQKGCSDTASVYYEKRPALQEFVQINERAVKRTVPPILLDYLGPILLVSSGASATTQISKTIALKYNRETTLIVFSRGF